LENFAKVLYFVILLFFSSCFHIFFPYFLRYILSETTLLTVEVTRWFLRLRLATKITLVHRERKRQREHIYASRTYMQGVVGAPSRCWIFSLRLACLLLSFWPSYFISSYPSPILTSSRPTYTRDKGL